MVATMFSISEESICKIERVAELVFAIVLGAICVSLFSDNVWRVFQSSDTGWLVRTGEYVLAHGLPATDLFSWTQPGKPWILYQWFFELCLGFFYKVGGLWLTGLVGLFVFSLIYFWLLPLSMASKGVKPVCIAGFLCLIVTPSWFWLRPQLFSFLLIIVFLRILEDFRINGLKRTLWLLPPLMVLWANSHSFWFIGLILILSYFVHNLSQRSNKDRLTLLTIAALSAGAVFINPYAGEILSYNFGFVSRPEIAAIKELHPILLNEPLDNLPLLLYFILTWSALIVGRHHVPSVGLWLSASGTVAALCCYRFAPLGVLLTWPYLSLVLSSWKFTSRESPEAPGGKRGALVLTVAPIVVAALVCLATYNSVFPYNKTVWFTHQHSNQGAIEFLKEHPELVKKMFCDDAAGCSMILENLGPVFIDTRFDFYGQDFSNQYRQCLYAQHGWQKLFQSWGINSACLRNSAPLCFELKNSKQWKCLFDDGQYSVFVLVKTE